MIELFIENRKIDLNEDLEITFTYENIDPDKLASIKNSFSKTVNVPGTPNNNITFGHIFRYDKYITLSGPSNIETYYDPHKKVNWFINKNGTLVNRGYCTLDNILIKNENEVTYQLTLYGGIGEFFYSLSYNENGSAKTLKDIWFNWKPKKSMYTYGDALDENEEAIETLMTISAENVAQSWHNLNPYYTYEGSTDFDKDVTLVPCYTGLYENFDSKHMLVSTFNPHFYGNTFMDDDTRSKYNKAFPDTYDEIIPTDDGDVTKHYYAISKNFTHDEAYRYGIVNFSRDIDPYEAGDLRVNELPAAIRLSKLMTAISNPINNGGYEVVWDDSIKSSNYWNYGWILLGKLRQTLENYRYIEINPSETYDGQETVLEINNENKTTLITSATNYTLPSVASSHKAGKYTVNLNYYPNWKFEYGLATWNYYSQRYDFISGMMKCWNINGYSGTDEGYFVWVTPFLINKIYENGNLRTAICDIFYYSSNENYYFGKNPKVDEATIKQKTEQWIDDWVGANQFGLTIDQFKWHNCVLDTSPTVRNIPLGYEIKCKFPNEMISADVEFQTENSNITIEQEQNVIYTKMYWSYQSNPTYYVDEFDIPQYAYPISFITEQYNTFSEDAVTRQHKYSFNLNTNKKNGIFSNISSGFNEIDLTKDILFANSESPMKYLTDFCKIMNYKFICDNQTKKITILPLRKYYIDTAIDINDNVDLGRDININPVIAKYKRINIGLDTPETYPVTLFNRISKEKFNTKKKDTGVDLTVTESDLLNSCIYKNLLDWQQSSVYHNIYPQLPRPYDVPSISWTLFDLDDVAEDDSLKKKEIFTNGVEITNSDNLFANVDFLPKPALFDNSNREKEAYPSLIFLNGFVKNYNYTKTYAPTIVTELQPDSIDTSHYYSISGNISSSSYQDIYKYDINETDIYFNKYYVTCSYSSSYGSYVANYMDSSNNRISGEYLQNTGPYTNALLHIPSGTTSIWINFRKADNSKKLIKQESDRYTVSPKLMLTNDTIEQYFIVGDRCYMWDFKYNDNLTYWGSFSNEQKGTATSWTIPFFSRDLYNLYNQETSKWEGKFNIVSSFNINYQESLDSIYDLSNTVFVKDPTYHYGSQVLTSDLPSSNEYYIPVIYNTISTERIYDTCWEGYIDDLYDRNTRDVTLYIDLSKYSDPNQIMRQTYVWKGSKWIITKMFNYKLSNIVNDRFVKVTLHKVIDIDAFVE